MLNFIHKSSIIILFLVSINTCFGQEEGAEIKVDTVPEYVKNYKKACALIDSAKYTDANNILKKVIKDNPDYYLAYNKMAVILIRNNKYKDAEKILSKAERIRPLNYETQKLRGIIYYETFKMPLAKNALDSAVEASHADKIDDVELLGYQALLMFEGKSYKSVIAVCQNILDIQPKYVDAIKLIGESRFILKDWGRAVNELTDAINAMPEKEIDYNFYKMRAKTKFELKDYQGAIKDWSSVLDANTKDEEAYVARANNKINIGDNSGAIADLDEAIKLNPKNPVSYCNRGVAKGQNKSNVEAMKDLDFAIKLKFDYAEAYFRRASIKLKSKDKHGACDDLSKADSLGDPDAAKYFVQFCKVK